MVDFHGLGFIAALLEEANGFRTLVKFVRDSQVAPLAAFDHPGRQIDRRAEEIKLVIRIDSKARADMQAAFEQQAGRRT